MMRRASSVYLWIFCSLLAAEEPPKALWEITNSLKSPDSACYDPASESIFISNIAGNPTRTDGEGWISRFDHKGKLIAERWVDGLNAPKGMRAASGQLWVADISRLLKFDIKTGSLLGTVFIASARFLNDIAIGPDGEVYVSDTLTSRILEYRDSKVSIFAQGDDLESPNGLLVRDGKLYVAAWGTTTDFASPTSGRLYSLDLKTKERVNITAEPLGNLDGLAWDGKGFLVSDFSAGKLYRVSTDGKSEVLMGGFKGAADFAWLSDAQVLVLPRMGEDKVSAFKF